jgi:hypothetical protein
MTTQYISDVIGHSRCQLLTLSYQSALCVVCGFQALGDAIEVGKFIALIGNSVSTKVSDYSVSYVLNECVFGYCVGVNLNDNLI